MFEAISSWQHGNFQHPTSIYSMFGLVLFVHEILVIHVLVASSASCETPSCAARLEEVEELEYRETDTTRLELLQMTRQPGRGAADTFNSIVEGRQGTHQTKMLNDLAAHRTDDLVNVESDLVVTESVMPEYAFTNFPERLLGTWLPSTTPQSILGPIAFNMGSPSFKAQRDNATGDIWFTVLSPQVFRVRENKMQYCYYGVFPHEDGEQSPFSVNSTSNESISFCWREGLAGMQTHAKGCTGCECASILIQMVDDEHLTFTFWMSPPVIHANLTLERSGVAPAMSDIEKIFGRNPYERCKFGECLPHQFCRPEDDDVVTSPAPMRPRHSTGCMTNMRGRPGLRMKAEKKIREAQQLFSSGRAASTQCFLLNGLSYTIDKMAETFFPTGSPSFGVPYIKLIVQMPVDTCNPCNVSYTVSAELAEDEYISIGFKGQSWETELSHPPTSRPCYFGMCVDPFDSFMSDRIALGYVSGSHGACVREMIAKDYVHTPSLDMTSTKDRKLSDTSVERIGKQTVMRFTVEQRWPDLLPEDLFRVMWAIGPVSEGSDCNATVGFHGIYRGVAPLTWLGYNSLDCVVEAFEAPKGQNVGGTI